MEWEMISLEDNGRQRFQTNPQLTQDKETLNDLMASLQQLMLLVGKYLASFSSQSSS